MPLLLLPLLGDSIKPVLQEQNKISNPETNEKSPWKFNQSLVAKPENQESIVIAGRWRWQWKQRQNLESVRTTPPSTA